MVTVELLKAVDGPDANDCEAHVKGNDVHTVIGYWNGGDFSQNFLCSLTTDILVLW